MPHLQTAIGTLNYAFSKDNIAKLVPHRSAFREGQELAQGIIVHEQMALHADWMKYLRQIPMGMQEAIRAIIHHSLGTNPPTSITWVWAPGYDYELAIWQAPDTRTSRGGISVLIKSRYPDDDHPLKNEPPYGS